MHRFFVNPEEIHFEEIRFSPVTSRQITRVLRLKSGDKVVVLDNSGDEMLTELNQVDDLTCTGHILKRGRCRKEPYTRLLMILGLTQREKFEWMLQKCTEVGAAAFIPVITSRSLVQHPEDVLSKYSRWKAILKEAAEQSGRGIIPELFDPATFSDILKTIPAANSLCLIPWEDEHRTSIRDLLSDTTPQKIAVFIGPEGGFSTAEIEQAAQAGFKPVSLGNRILRMETAAVVAAALVMYEAERD